MNTVILEVVCDDEECGMVSIYEFWPDASFKAVLKACAHPKRLPRRAEVLRAIEKELIETPNRP